MMKFALVVQQQKPVCWFLKNIYVRSVKLEIGFYKLTDIQEATIHANPFEYIAPLSVFKLKV